MFQRVSIATIRLYQVVISPIIVSFLGPSARCRFNPSCSQYALEAIQIHGVIAGSWLALRRLARCHPWGACGDDPVPEKTRISSASATLACGGTGACHGS
ncbi:MAG TPA: membrane protein insertion efficiency factor YidD [Verrucomicrobiae bacterium]